MKTLLCLVAFVAHISVTAQELFYHKSYFELYLLSRMAQYAQDQDKHRLFAQASPLNTTQPGVGPALFFQDIQLFAHGMYSVKTVVIKDVEKSIFYIDQCLSKTANPQKILCALKGSIIQNLWDNHVFLAHIETPLEHRKKGYARSLMLSLEKLAINARCEKITLDSTKPALDFYTKLGYRYDSNRLDDFDETVPLCKPAHLFCTH